MRRDARLRRERLLRAAVELYDLEGVDVALERIAERAEVGRGTLYRNFPDRAALAAAVQEARLAEFAAQVEAWGDRDDAFLLALKALARLVLASAGFEKIVPMEQEAPQLARAFRAGVEAVLAAPLARAQAAGLVRADFTVGEAHRVALMLAGGGLESRGVDPAGSIDLALELLLRGVAPPRR